MKKSDELRTELEKINARIKELTTNAADQTKQFETAQNAFAAGKGSLDDSLAAQQKSSLLAEAIKSLESQREAVTAQLNEAVAGEKRESIITEAKVVAEDAHQILTEYQKERAEFDQIIQERGEKLAGMFRNFGEKARSFDKLLRTVTPEAGSAELTQKGLPEELRAEVYRAIWHQPTLEYANLVLQAIFNKWGVEEFQRQRAAREKELAESRNEAAKERAAQQVQV
jgi:hypothetical protein